VARIKSGDIVARFSLDGIEPDFHRAELRLEGLIPPVETFCMRVFADDPHANGKTPTEGNPHYLGAQYFYGLGDADEAYDGQNAAFRLGRESQSKPTELRLNITLGLRAYLAQATRHEAPISLVTVDRHGHEILEPDLHFEGVLIVTT
jgi:hypothetical protein